MSGKKLSHCRKEKIRALTGALRWRGRTLEQEFQCTEIETDELAGESRTVGVTKWWWPVPEFVERHK
jgi:hypothetical protein